MKINGQTPSGVRIGTFAVLFMLFSLIYSKTYSQEQIINFPQKNMSIRSVFEQIERQTNMSVDYDETVVNINKTVNLSETKLKLGKALSEVLKDISYNLIYRDTHIIITKEQKKAEQNSVSGKVTDSEGTPLPLVNVLIKGTSIGVFTDDNGKYSISVPVNISNPVLTYSFIGYAEKEQVVNNRSVMDVILSGEVDKLDEVIVVGYGTQRKVTTTGAVAKVEGSDIARLNLPNVQKGLQGLTSGITIVDRGGAPGDDNPNIFLRGVGTTGNSMPLILVDGIEMNLNQVPAQDIENISILKDAASASIYGSRAAHGVILVTTKRGKAGKMKLSYEGYYGIQDRATKAKDVSREQYIDMVNEASRHAGNKDIFNSYEYPYTNYPAEVYQSNYITEHTMNLSGGSEAGRYLASFNYMDQPGLTNNTFYKRYNFRLNTDLNVGENLKVSADLLFQHSNRLWPQRLGDAQRSAWSMVPTVPVRYENGNYTLDDQGDNPVASLDLDVSGKRIYMRDALYGQVKADYSLFKDFTLTGVASLNGTWSRDKIHTKNYKFYNAKNEFVREWNSQNGVSDERNNEYLLTLRALANYKKRWSNHDVNVLLGVEQISYRNYYLRGERKNLISDDVPDISIGDARNQYADGKPSLWGINSYFGRINYSYKDRYLFEANIRRDGSSRFAKGNKWGTFPSFSAAWRLSEEGFLNSIDAINNLKIRASWGQTGNERIGEFMYLAKYDVENIVINGILQSGVTQKVMANPNITWETVELTNFGLDFSLFKNSIFGELDYYVKDTKDILLELAIPQFIGLQAPPQNAGVVRNSGIETILGYRKMNGNFKFSITTNFSYNKNKWIDRGNDKENIDGWTIQREGYALNSFYIFRSNGLIANEADLAAYKKQHKEDPRGIGKLTPGDIKFVDINNDGTIDDKDREIKAPNIPKFTFGLTINTEYKGFDLSLFFQGATGSNRYIYGEWYEGPSYAAFTGKHFLDRWTDENQNPNAKVPRLESASNRNASKYNSFFLKNNKYLRLKNIQLGYTLPRSILEKIFIEQARIYVSGTNLFTFSGLDQGLDPEMSSGRLANFPPLKIISVGANITF